MLYANYNTKTQQTRRAKWSERPKPKPNETKTKSQKTKAMSHKPSEAKWSHSEAKAKSQKPKAKWARKWEILAPKCMQNTDFSSNMQQIARKAAPCWKTKKDKKRILKKKQKTKKNTLHSALQCGSHRIHPDLSCFCLHLPTRCMLAANQLFPAATGLQQPLWARRWHGPAPKAECHEDDEISDI